MAKANKLYIKTDNPDFFFQVEFQEKGFETGCVFVDDVPEWIRSSKNGRARLHPHIISEANELGKSYDNLKVSEPVEYWAV